MLRLYNTLSRKKEPFVPLEPGVVRMYSCGPTVYRYAHIGNMRSYLLADWLRRLLEVQGNRVEHVKNITDVGHMRQEMVERGEDKMIAAALAEGKSLQEIASHYTLAFLEDEAKLGIRPAKVFPKATEHVDDMVRVTERLVKQGYAYVEQGNVYFDVSRFPGYGELSGNRTEDLLAGVRVETDPTKHHQTDFALWKAAEPGRSVKWPSPWGEGFPGWHIECTAMSTRYLGEQLDIHTGGVDNIFPHHEDERAQSECAFGVPFVRYWVHGQHLLADGLKMAKSTGNSYTLSDLEQLGFDPLAFRYLCLAAHYRSRLNFTFKALRAAQRGLVHLRTLVREWLREPQEPADHGLAQRWRARFLEAVEDDLGLPEALAIVWEMARSTLPPGVKLGLADEFDRVLGLGLAGVISEGRSVPEHIERLVTARHEARAERDLGHADAIRAELRSAGYQVRDRRASTLVLPEDRRARPDRLIGALSSAADLPSLLAEPDRYEFSINILARDYREDVERCLESVRRTAAGRDVQILIVDNFSTDGTGEWADEVARTDPRVQVFHADHNLGEGAGRNVGLKQSLGRYILLLDPSVEVTGDVFTPLAEALEDRSAGLAGPWGLCSADMRHFEEASHAEVDTVAGYCMAFRRELLTDVGLLDEKFRFYRNLDIDFSIGVKARGYLNRMLPDLPVRQHMHRAWETTPIEERDKMSRRNFYRLLSRWGHRTDLLYHTVHG